MVWGVFGRQELKAFEVGDGRLFLALRRRHGQKKGRQGRSSDGHLAV